MNRLRQWSMLAVLLFTIGLLAALHGHAQSPGEKIAGDGVWLVDRDLSLSPARAPIPALRYRLYPSSWERKPGDAVPIYLRFAHERSDGEKRKLREKPYRWSELPLDKLPRDEVKKFLDSYKYNFRQLDLGARRKTADWNYTLELDDPIGILLPDVQEMRMHGQLLILKARFEIAERRYTDAVRTLETGFSFSQQVGNGPFLINGLVGVALTSSFADTVAELIDRPDAPNLYWALAVLPRPLIDLRKGFEWEQVLMEKEFPDMADLDTPRTSQQWDVILKRVRERMDRLDNNPQPPPGNGPNAAASDSPDLPAARKHLIEVVKLPKERVKAMPAARVLLLHMSNYYHELRDEIFKAVYLPYPQSHRIAVEADKRLKAARGTEATRLAHMLLPAIHKVQLAQVRMDRKLAMLRAIEALRMHLAINKGQLPKKLSDVKIVPVPNDPGTGQPFEYRLEGQIATLIGRIPGEPTQIHGLRYRLTVQK